MAGFLSFEVEMADGVNANVGTSDNTVSVRHPVYLYVDDPSADHDHYFWLEPERARALAAQLIAAADHAEGR